MATHTVHPGVYDHGLQDGCPRCDELATSPLELDNPNFVRAWERMIAVEFGMREPQRLVDAEQVSSYRSGNEATLCGLLYTWAVFLERYTPIDPRELPDQLAA